MDRVIQIEIYVEVFIGGQWMDNGFLFGQTQMVKYYLELVIEQSQFCVYFVEEV